MGGNVKEWIENHDIGITFDFPDFEIPTGGTITIERPC